MTINEHIQALRSAFTEQYGIEVEVTIWAFGKNELTHREAKIIQSSIAAGTDLEPTVSDHTQGDAPLYTNYTLSKHRDTSINLVVNEPKN